VRFRVVWQRCLQIVATPLTWEHGELDDAQCAVGMRQLCMRDVDVTQRESRCRQVCLLSTPLHSDACSLASSLFPFIPSSYLWK
jgi:hypothetical protein